MRSIFMFLIVGLVLGACARDSRSTVPRAPQGLAAQRALQLDRLHAYRVAGVFPVDANGYPISVFRDGRGKPCPMAALIERSGHRALVDRVVRDDNTLRLADVHDGPLLDWMLASGLTQEEVAYAQGAMDIDYGSFQLPSPADAIQLVARRLDAVEHTLRENTGSSLAIASARLRATQAQVASSH